jgi:hypothetical protein
VTCILGWQLNLATGNRRREPFVASSQRPRATVLTQTPSAPGLPLPLACSYRTVIRARNAPSPVRNLCVIGPPSRHIVAETARSESR